jgi:hypothetical protein
MNVVGLGCLFVWIAGVAALSPLCHGGVFRYSTRCRLHLRRNGAPRRAPRGSGAAHEKADNTCSSSDVPFEPWGFVATGTDVLARHVAARPSGRDRWLVGKELVLSAFSTAFSLLRNETA